MTDAERILTDTLRKDAMNKLALILAGYMDEMGMFKTCLNCEHWIEGTQVETLLPPESRQMCKLYGARPPTKIIVCGCESHSDNIPY